MKRGINLILGIFILISLSTFVIADCDLDVSLLNQDPYPAVPGDYVKLIFQITGVENPECGNVFFELIPKYPISFDPGVDSSVQIRSGTFTKDFDSFLMVPYKVRVDADALDGDNPVDVNYLAGTSGQITESFQFDLNVDDVRVDFEVNIKDYDYATNILTLEILNIGDSDVEAVTIEITEQENINIKGSSKNIVGALDSNDYTTADFEATLEDGEIDLTIYYTDEINVRRTTQESIYFNPNSFQKRKADQNGTSKSTYILVFLVIVGVIYWLYKRNKKKKMKLKRKQQQAHHKH